MCFRETPFTALQQGDINDLLRVSVPVQISRVIIILASNLFSSLTIDVSTVPSSLAMSSEPNVLPASAAPGSAASVTSAVPGPTPTVAQSTPRDSVGPLLALLITFDNRSLLKSEIYNIAFANPYKVTVI